MSFLILTHFIQKHTRILNILTSYDTAMPSTAQLARHNKQVLKLNCRNFYDCLEGRDLGTDEGISGLVGEEL